MRNINFKSIYIDYVAGLYKIDMDYQDFINNAMIGWEKIGNKDVKINCIIEDTQDCRIYLPCGAWAIEGVFSNMIDGVMTSNKTTFPYIKSSYIETYIEMWKRNTSLVYNKGKLLEYVTEGDCLVFSHDHNDVTIIYKQIILDEDGFPYVNEKEAEAIATFCVYNYFQTQGFLTRDQNTLTLSQMMERKWNALRLKARTPMYLSQNDMDKILDSKYSWDRKQYGKSYKPDR